MDDSRRWASDFELWVRFFRYAKLYSVDALIGGFRSHPDSLGLQNLEECHRIQSEIIEKELAATSGMRGVRLFRAISTRVLRNAVLAKPWSKVVIGTMTKWPGGSRAPVIRHRKTGWVMED